jgi:hypothetical protein
MAVEYKLGGNITSWCAVKDHAQEFENSKPEKGISDNIQKAPVLGT